MAEEDKVSWKLGQQKTFGIEAIDRPNLREMQEYITGQDMMDFYNTASQEEIKAVNKLASSIIYGGRGGMVSAAQYDQLLSSPDYRKKMQKMGADLRKAASGSTREAKLRMQAINLQAQADLPEGNLPMRFTDMPKSATPPKQQPKPAITDPSDTPSDDEGGAGGLLDDTGATPFRKRRSLIGR